MGRLRRLWGDIRFRMWVTTAGPIALIFTGMGLLGRAMVRDKYLHPATGGGPAESAAGLDFAGVVIFILTALGMVASTVITLQMLNRGIRPLQEVSRLAKLMVTGNYGVRVHSNPGDPDLAAELAADFNALAESLERTDRLRRELVANLAHEIRTPLTNLQGYLEALADGVIEPTTENLTLVHEEGVRMVRLVDALHQLARADALRQRPMQVDYADLDALADQLLRVMRPHADSKHIRMHCNLGASPKQVPVHADSIAQVMRNLVRNAVQYTEDGGTIRIQTFAVANRYTLTCLNTGGGIPAEDLPFIFQRFYRTEKAKQSSSGGVGLGLAICKELIEAHGGRIGADSKAGWTSFWFELPLERGTRLDMKQPGSG